jgi:hypothetical protein
LIKSKQSKDDFFTIFDVHIVRRIQLSKLLVLYYPIAVVSCQDIFKPVKVLRRFSKKKALPVSLFGCAQASQNILTAI